MAGRQPGGAAMKALLHGIAEGNGRTLRNLLGLLIFIGGGYLLGRHALLLAELNLPAPIVLALKGGLLCAFGTALGAMPVLVVKTMPARLSDALLGFGAGVMLSATAFSLIMPALSAAGDLGYSKFGAGFLVSFGLAVGVMGLFILGRLMPDVHPGCEGAPLSGGIPPRILLFVTAIVLHNIPEGMAVGVSAGAGLDEANGLALGIALQDVPEGLVVALVLAGIGMSRFKAMLVGAASGLVEPLFAVLCAWLVGLSALLLPWGLAAAAGAMLFVVTHEIIPESHRQGHAAEATLGLVFGFCLMMVLDTALG
ncbi:TPA: ZIP family metal transporter [Pseudomonas aeruginosa]|nr:ZIP family metal transporter [Pseudomonas aeruginosa]